MSDSVWADNFRENLRVAVDYRDTTFSDLAQQAKVARPALSRLVNGRQTATLDHAGRLADTLRIPFPAMVQSPAQFKLWILERSQALTREG